MNWEQMNLSEPLTKISEDLTKTLELDIQERLQVAIKKHATKILSFEIKYFDETKVELKFESFYFAVFYNSEKVGRVYFEVNIVKAFEYEYTMRYEPIIQVEGLVEMIENITKNGE